jgi:hypothetical protein
MGLCNEMGKKEQIRGWEAGKENIRISFDKEHIDEEPAILSIYDSTAGAGIRLFRLAETDTGLLTHYRSYCVSRNAKPENQRQRDLVAYFENKKKLSNEIFESYSEEKAAENPNYPLIRKYFKEANKYLKSLLLYGLDNYQELRLTLTS